MLNKLPGARCDECSLRECPVVPPTGPKDAKLVVIGEAPGAQEEKQGEPFVGPSGQLLDYALKKNGVDPKEVYKTNVVMCRPPDNREPDAMEVDACRPRLIMEMQDTTGPVLALGKVASEALDLTSYGRGTVVDFDGRKVMHTYHPAYILRKPDDSGILFDDIERLVNNNIVRNPKWEDPDVVFITDPEELDNVLSAVPDGTWVAFDTETDNTKWFKSYDGTPADPLLMLQLAWEDEWAVVIDDVMLYDTPGVPAILNRFFSRVKTAAHNGKFDQIFLLSHIGVNVKLDFDTMIAHYAIDENALHGLKELSFKYFGIPDYEERLIKQYLRSRNDRYSKIPFEPFAKYGAIDVIMVLQFRKMFQQVLERQGRLEWPFQKVMMRANNNFVKMEIRGIQFDVPYLQQVQETMQIEMDRLQKKAGELVGLPDINLQSPQQVAVVVYDMLGFPQPKNRRLPARSTNHAAMEPHKGKHPFIDTLMEYRRVAKMKNSYADNIYEALDENGVVHTTFLQHQNEVGRLSARNPALQTIPRGENEKDHKGFWGAMIKACFIARPGMKLGVVDYSQAELRVAAVEANEPFLYDVYEHGRDLHTEVAIAMFGPNWTKEQRMQTKMFNFSYLYGGSEYSFAQDAGLPINVARKFVQDYNAVMPKLAEYRKEQFRLLCEQGYVQSRFGRRRNFEIITRMNMDDARKACVHAPIAGTASDLTLLSGCELEEEEYNVLILVHDSVVLEMPAEQADEIVAHAVEVFETTGQTYMPQVKWKADPEVRIRWCDPPSILLPQTQLTS